MSRGEKENIISRTIVILACIGKSGGATIKELAARTNVGERTIQRDMIALERIAIAQKGEGRKWFLTDGVNFAKQISSIMEKRFLAAYMDALKDIPQFSDIINKFQKNLTYNFDVFKVITERPMELSGVHYETIEQLSTHIRNRCKIKLNYKRDGDIAIIMSPYRIVYYDGFWYVAGVTEYDNKLIKLRVDFICDLEAVNSADLADGIVIFKEDPDIAAYIDNATSAWFNDAKIPVTVLLQEPLIDTFSKRRIFNEQILEYQDGKCFLSFTVANFQDFFASMARYMPLFDIISPSNFNEELKTKINKYS